MDKMDIYELVKKCEKKINWKLKPACYSFTGNSDYFGEILDAGTKEADIDIEKFIKVCDNRIKWAEMLLKDVATVLGFSILGISIIYSITKDALLSIFLLFVASIIGVPLLFNYRAHIHAWAAFKEWAVSKE